MAVQAVCVVDDCDKPVRSRGWCQKHYLRWYNYGEPEPKNLLRQTPGFGVCAIEGCDSAGTLIRGWCLKHYQRWQTHGDPLVSLIDREQTGHPCEYEGCGRAAGFKGFCNKHYTQWRKVPERSAAAARHAAINPISETDAAYIAGLIDADGMVSASAGQRAQPLVIVTNSNLALLDWLREVIGAGTIYEQKTRAHRAGQDRRRWNKVHRFQIGNRKAQSLLERCRPYMRVKGRQADLVLALPQRGRDFGRQATVEQKSAAEMLRSEIRALNARGVRDPLYL